MAGSNKPDIAEDRGKRLRLRAEEARTVAEGMQSPEARQWLLGVAANYDRLADYIEGLAKPEREREDSTG